MKAAYSYIFSSLFLLLPQWPDWLCLCSLSSELWPPARRCGDHSPRFTTERRSRSSRPLPHVQLRRSRETAERQFEADMWEWRTVGQTIPLLWRYNLKDNVAMLCNDRRQWCNGDINPCPLNLTEFLIWSSFFFNSSQTSLVKLTRWILISALTDCYENMEKWRSDIE